MASSLRTLSFAAVALLTAAAAHAEVVKLKVEQRQPFAERDPALREADRALLRRARSETAAERRHHRHRAGAAQRPRHGGVFGHLHHPQAGGHEQGHRRAGVPGAQPRPRQHRRRRLLRRLPRQRPRARRERLAGRYRAGRRHRDDGDARGAQPRRLEHHRPGDGPLLRRAGRAPPRSRSSAAASPARPRPRASTPRRPR